MDEENKRRKIYQPTQKAQDLAPILQALAVWGEKHSSLS